MTKNNDKKVYSLPDLKKIETYCDLMNNKKLTEIEIETDEIRIRIVSETKNNNIQYPSISTINHDQMFSSKNDSDNLSSSGNQNYAGEIVRSPMVGTAYLSPEPNTEKFVKKGDKVKEGQTLLIVEAMKVMNSIPCPVNGIVDEVLVEDSQPIEYDQPLIKIR